MKITEQTDSRLVMSGVPGGAVWMVVFVVFGLAATAGALAFGVLEWRRGNWFALIWIGIGLAVAQVFLWTGVVTLARGRERLELDRSAGRGRYEVVSPIIETGSKPFAFDLADVDAVSFELRVEHNPGGHGASGIGLESEVWRARLRVRAPRRTVVLAETRNDDTEVRALAERIAEFLGVDFADATSRDEPEERRAPDALDTPLAARESMGGLTFPAPPADSEWAIEIDPETERVRITASRAGGPAVFGCFLGLLTVFGVIAAAMSVAAWLPGQTFNGQPMTPTLQIPLTLPALAGAVVIPWMWVSLARGRRQIEITPDELTSRWLYPGRPAVRALPGVSRLAASGRSVCTARIESVRSVSGADGRAVEIRTDDARLRIGSRLDGDAEQASVRWLAGVVRVGVRAMGAPA